MLYEVITDYSRIYYQIVIIDMEEKLDISTLDRLYHISDIIVTDMPVSKKKFIIDKSFSIIKKHFP